MSISDPVLVYVSALQMGFLHREQWDGFLGVWAVVRVV